MAAFTIQDFFKFGMKKHIPTLLFNHGKQIELGPGNNPVPDTIGIGLPQWDANYNSIQFDNETIDVIHAYHFFEHLQEPVYCLSECQRVLKYDGHINIVVPHHKSDLAFEDINHQKFFAEDTWKSILTKKGYNSNEFNWKFKINVNFMMAVNERNMAIFTQLQKVKQ